MTETDPQAPETEKEETFLSHLVELRDRLLRVVLAVLLVFVCLFPFANRLYTLLAEPLIEPLREAGGTMIIVGTIAPFLVPLKLALLLSVAIALPYVLYQLWAFIAPGLYKHEKRLAVPILTSSTVLFYIGMTFAYFVVFPLVFRFLIATTPPGTEFTPDIGHYLDFVLIVFFAFGLAFEVPVVTVVLVAMGMTTPENLARKRPYIIVGAFIIGMLLTPPDVISQVMLAIPVWILFEAGLIFSRYFLPKTEDDNDDRSDDESVGEPVAVAPVVAEETPEDAKTGTAQAPHTREKEDQEPADDEHLYVKPPEAHSGFEEDDDYDYSDPTDPPEDGDDPEDRVDTEDGDDPDNKQP
ncbi:MAG: twin-arginine translocase subunit TatC [Gammaproteobacteria bacterium]